MSEPIEFTPYECSLGTVTGHSAGSYIIATPDGRVIGIPANEEPSAEAVENDIANPPSPAAAPVVLTPLTILARLAPTEEAAFVLSNDPEVRIIRQRFTAAMEVRTDDERTIQGIQVLITKGIITSERAAEVFS